MYSSDDNQDMLRGLVPGSQKHLGLYPKSYGRFEYCILFLSGLYIDQGIDLPLSRHSTWCSSSLLSFSSNFLILWNQHTSLVIYIDDSMVDHQLRVSVDVELTHSLRYRNPETIQRCFVFRHVIGRPFELDLTINISILLLSGDQYDSRPPCRLALETCQSTSSNTLGLLVPWIQCFNPLGYEVDKNLWLDSCSWRLHSFQLHKFHQPLRGLTKGIFSIGNLDKRERHDNCGLMGQSNAGASVWWSRVHREACACEALSFVLHDCIH